MGTWGLGPFDNDAAGDFVAKLTKPIERALALRDPTYNEARACAQFLVLSHGTDLLGGPGLVNVVKLLVKMRSDKEWISNWNSPRKIANVIDKEIEAVLDRMRACRGCRRDNGDCSGSALDEARALVENMPTWRPPSRSVRTRLKVTRIATAREKFTRAARARTKKKPK